MKTILATLTAALLLSLGAGCVTSKSKPPPGTALDQAARAIFEADVAFARMSMERGIGAAFEFFTTPESVHLPAAGPVDRGNQAIAEAMSGPPGATLNWRPESAEVATSGDFGFTYGTYEYRIPNPQGAPLVNTGRYLTVWRRRNDGAWKVAVDIGNVVR